MIALLCFLAGLPLVFFIGRFWGRVLRKGCGAAIRFMEGSQPGMRRRPATAAPAMAASSNCFSARREARPPSAPSWRRC